MGNLGEKPDEGRIKAKLSRHMQDVWDAASACLRVPSYENLAEFKGLCRPAEVVVLLRLFGESVLENEPVDGVEMRSCKFVLLSDVLPEQNREWWADLISTSAPFSYGDNNRTLVTASRVRKHCAESTGEGDPIPVEARDAFLERLEMLGETYIDLEN